MSEEKSADSAPVPQTVEPVTQSFGEASAASVPRQSSPDRSEGAEETVEESFGTAPAGAKPAGAAPADTKPADTKPADTEPGGPAPEKPAAEKVEQSIGSAPEKVEQSFGSAEPEVARPPAGEAGAAAPRPRKRRSLLTAIVVVVVVLSLAGAGYLVARRVYSDPTRNAAAGDCLTNLPVVDPGQDREAPDASVVACSDATASYRIEGRVDNQTAAQAKTADVCKGYPAATFIYRAVPDTGTGYVLCLKKLTP